jgi:glutamate-1-semialdehyde 2,1-aminomutase
MTTLYQKPRPLSQAFYSSICDMIPGGVNSPIRSFQKVGQLPIVVEEGKGAMITDIDGHSYIDYVHSWGPLIHGHAHPKILKRTKKRMEKGTSFGMSSVVEKEIAEKITQLVPSVEKIRFVSSGTEATMTALRVARGYTGRDVILKFSGHYHGHVDALLVQAGSGLAGLTATSSSKGIPEGFVQKTVVIPFNDFKAAELAFHHPDLKDKIAAIILEPVAANMGVVLPAPGFLFHLRRLCDETGALLIFDEVITGFRLGLQGAQGLFGITPDLSCFGKIIGGGFPAAAIGGKKEIMDTLAPIGSVYQAGTLSGNPVALEAGLATLELAEEPGFYEELERKTLFLTQPIEKYIRDRNLNASLQQIGSLFTIFFGKRKITNFQDVHELDLATYSAFFQHLFNRGILAPPLYCEAWFVSQAHEMEHLEKTRDEIIAFLETL